jgi:hypothetical protein
MFSEMFRTRSSTPVTKSEEKPLTVTVYRELLGTEMKLSPADAGVHCLLPSMKRVRFL